MVRWYKFGDVKLFFYQSPFEWGIEKSPTFWNDFILQGMQRTRGIARKHSQSLSNNLDCCWTASSLCILRINNIYWMFNCQRMSNMHGEFTVVSISSSLTVSETTSNTWNVYSTDRFVGIPILYPMVTSLPGWIKYSTWPIPSIIADEVETSSPTVFPFIL